MQYLLRQILLNDFIPSCLLLSYWARTLLQTCLSAPGRQGDDVVFFLCHFIQETPELLYIIPAS